MPRKIIETAAKFIPPKATLNQLRDIARGCTACHLYKLGTQTVFGEGRSSSRIIMVGEQPGDKEDIVGRPFVGPAGGVLDKGLAAAGIDRDEVYVTNIVKHFKWEPRGKKRIHKKPNTLEIMACTPWFEAEVKNVKPDAIVALGATAAQALMGKSFKVTQQRGKLLTHQPTGIQLIATVHPSSILRAPDDESRRQAMADFVADLKVIAKHLRKLPKAA